MDFLDPKAKKRHTVRLYIGYALMAALILTTSSILVFSAYGFDVDRKTGQVIQNGLLFVDSAPDGAQVVINDTIQKDKTNNRFAMPAGDYSLKIQKEGYRDWRRNFQLTGGGVERFTYPLLIPNTLNSREVQTYDAVPTFVTESPDRRWVLVNQGNSLSNFTEYDLNNLVEPADNPQARAFTLPTDLFTAAEGAHSIEAVEWSTDNEHVLVKHSFATGFEFVIISRDEPATSININKLLTLNPTAVTLRDKKFDQWYLFTQDGGILQAADAKKVIAPVATGVTSYKSHDNDTLLYASAGTDGKTQRITLKQKDTSYKVKDVANGAVMLDIARYDGKWHMVIGVDSEQKTYVYIDPLNVLQKKDNTPLVPVTILKSVGTLTSVSFSDNTRFIAAQSGQHFEVYDAEYRQTFRYDITDPFDPAVKVDWIDGHRLTGRVAGKAIIFDFDGSNKQELLANVPQASLLFDRDYTVMYTINASKATAGKSAFYGTDLRLDGDK